MMVTLFLSCLWPDLHEIWQLIYSIYGTGWSSGMLGTDLGKNLEGPVSVSTIMLP